MKIFLKILASLLLLCNGAGAVYGGWNLILHPDGRSIQLSMHWLEDTPFRDYLIPGIILFTVNGLCSFFVLAMMLLNVKKFPSFIIAQGIVLNGWLIIQMLMIHTIYFLHYVLGTVGILLILSGLMLRMNQNK